MDTRLSTRQPDSPFLRRQPLKLRFSFLLLLLMMVVGAGIGMLLYLAVRVPAVSAELRSYFGLTEVVVDTEAARKAHIIFVIFLYTAPLGLGIFVYCLHHILNWLSRVTQPAEEPEEFRME